MKHAALIAAAVLVGAVLFALGFLVGDAGDGTVRPQNDSGEIQALIWEASPGAGQPPRCDSVEADGVGRWTCEVFYPPREAPTGVTDVETCALDVTADGSVEGRCQPSGRSVSGTIAR